MLKYSIDEITTEAWAFDEDLRRYQEAGVPAVALRLSKMQAYGTDRAVRLVDDSGLTVSTLCQAGLFTLSDRSRWPYEIDQTVRALDLAARVGAKRLLLLSGPAGPLRPDEADEGFWEILQTKVLPEAQRLGVPIVLEPSSQLRIELGYLHTHHDVLYLIDEIDSPYLALCMEISTAWVERWLYEVSESGTVCEQRV